MCRTFITPPGKAINGILITAHSGHGLLPAERLLLRIAYAIDKGDSKQQGFQQILRNIGFEVKLKPYIQRSDGSAKGDWDVGITLDVIEYAAKSDVIVLLSGDGDFDLLLNKVRSSYDCNNRSVWRTCTDSAFSD